MRAEILSKRVRRKERERKLEGAFGFSQVRAWLSDLIVFINSACLTLATICNAGVVTLLESQSPEELHNPPKSQSWEMAKPRFTPGHGGVPKAVVR